MLSTKHWLLHYQIFVQSNSHVGLCLKDEI